ncbi:MAG: alpha/beta fold hydrolase [Bdellovibrionales bacterium]
MYLNGGPIGTDHYSYRFFEKFEERHGIGFIYIDQRGTGCSSQIPLSQNIEIAARSSFYSTDQIVYDAEFLRLKLLGQMTNWRLFGQSFGGVIATRYLMLFPEHIQSVHNYAGALFDHFYQFFGNRILRNNIVANKVLGQNNMRQLAKVRSYFREDDCLEPSPKTKVCGLALAQLYFEEGLGDKQSWPLFIKELNNEIIRPDGRVNLELIKSKVGFGLGYFFSPRFVASRAVWRQEAQTSLGTGPSRKDCQLAYQYLKSNGINVDNLVLNHCLIILFADKNFDPNFVNQVVQFYPIRKLLTVKEFEKRLGQTKIPYFFYAGELDIYDISSDLMKNLSRKHQNLRYIEFQGEDHFGYFNQDLVWKNLSQY